MGGANFPADANLRSTVSSIVSLENSYLYSMLIPSRKSTCCDGDVKLLGRSILSEGRVELCVSGEWKTLCDDNWSKSEAQVVCEQLGYSHQGTLRVIWESALIATPNKLSCTCIN